MGGAQEAILGVQARFIGRSIRPAPDVARAQESVALQSRAARKMGWPTRRSTSVVSGMPSGDGVVDREFLTSALMFIHDRFEGTALRRSGHVRADERNGTSPEPV